VPTIVLDSNVFSDALDLRAVDQSMLQHLAKMTGLTVALPRVVVEEVLARYARRLQKTVREAEDARQKVRELSDMRITSVPILDVEAEQKNRRGQLGMIFTILPTPAGAAEEGLRREAWRETPCKPIGKEQTGTGARDTAIWLTARDLCDSGETVYFVTENKTDFGRDGRLHPDLDRELAEPSRFVYCDGVEALLGHLGEKRPLLKETELAAVLAHVRVYNNGVRRVLSHQLDSSRVLPPSVGFPFASWAGAGARNIRLAPGRRWQQSYSIGGTHYLIVHSRWFSEYTVSGLLDNVAVRTVDVEARFDVSLLIQLADDGSVAADAKVLGVGPMLHPVITEHPAQV
jgi:predicted nucleic acid-binding protein